MDFYLDIYFPLLFVFMAVFFLYIGIKVIVSKRPLLFPSKIFFIFMLLAFSPQFIMSFERFASPTFLDMGIILYISPLMFVVILAFMWIQMKGYMAIGISDNSFRNAIHYSLNKNQIEFEEQLSLIKLTSIKSELQVAVQSWVGTGQLKLKKSKDKDLMFNLISSINEYYTSNTIKPNNITSIFYIVMGGFMLIFASSSYFFTR
ncbi:hypothetical protein RI844_04400 [Thalassotalea fonticola]|uniref:Uncharacterized protein n=1 Tax=Thalassotalea fonticola TaxID=3065649 RepID=A0ABZ0GRZ3_9GAMM|nr:hypothetical protein RI844_04400 [Colwelliaceae bacterium S1-1]